MIFYFELERLGRSKQRHFVGVSEEIGNEIPLVVLRHAWDTNSRVLRSWLNKSECV